MMRLNDALNLKGNDQIWRRYGLDMLQRAGVDEQYTNRMSCPPAPQLPPGAGEYLVESNERLRDLIQQYSTVSFPALEHSQWTESYVSSEIPLLSFRGDSALLWQQRDLNLPVNYLLAYQYLLSSGHGALLAQLQEDELFGPYAIYTDEHCLTRDRLDSICEIAFLEKHLAISGRPQLHILDIGAGYGRLAHRLVQAFKNIVVSCTDAIARCSFLCEYYLSFRGVQQRARTLPLTEVESGLSQGVDIAVNVHSFSECSLAAITWWVKLLRKNDVRYLMIVPNRGEHEGKLLMSKEPDGTYKEFGQMIEETGYRRMIVEPKYRNHMLQRFGITPTHYHLFECERRLFPAV